MPMTLDAPNLEKLRFELDIRAEDWKEEAIKPAYFAKKLAIIQEKIQTYKDGLPKPLDAPNETTAVPATDQTESVDFVPPLPSSPPPDQDASSQGFYFPPQAPWSSTTSGAEQNENIPKYWIPIWSEDYNQYYYMHSTTGEITWTAPQLSQDKSTAEFQPPLPPYPPGEEPKEFDSQHDSAEPLQKKSKAVKQQASSLKTKKLANMVEKWKSAQADASDDEDEQDNKATSEMDAETLEKAKLKKIEEWKRKQLENMSIAKENPNFTPLPISDWRIRVNLARQRDMKKLSESSTK
eukprot:TRINITY_DN1687_c0_g1_i10.p1 TRINITY_DN1687_c0_g1~~TRINITY_DN1687_c0_g1_i10.p1  ORF type:complete len:294 (-),score=85.32 TRINITY_DN1687_c0_g1_i10:134-1015(-)